MKRQVASTCSRDIGPGHSSCRRDSMGLSAFGTWSPSHSPACFRGMGTWFSLWPSTQQVVESHLGRGTERCDFGTLIPECRLEPCQGIGTTSTRWCGARTALSWPPGHGTKLCECGTSRPAHSDTRPRVTAESCSRSCLTRLRTSSLPGRTTQRFAFDAGRSARLSIVLKDIRRQSPHLLQSNHGCCPGPKTGLSGSGRGSRARARTRSPLSRRRSRILPCGAGHSQRSSTTAKKTVVLFASGTHLLQSPLRGCASGPCRSETDWDSVSPSSMRAKLCSP